MSVWLNLENILSEIKIAVIKTMFLSHVKVRKVDLIKVESTILITFGNDGGQEYIKVDK